MDVKHTSFLLAFIAVSVIGAELLVTLACWLIGVIFTVAFYKQNLSENTPGFFVMIFASFLPVANDLGIQFIFGSQWIFFNKLQYLVTPFLIYTIFAAGQYFANSYHDEKQKQ